MSIKEILKHPNPILNTPCLEVAKNEIKGFEIQTLIEDMIDTCHSAGGVGLAAPQVGISKRLFILLYSDGTAEAFINPEIVSRKEISHCKGEGCLSLPEQRFNVKRHKKVEITYLDAHGDKQTLRTKSKRLAQEIQHEMDHLDGITLAEKGKKVA